MDGGVGIEPAILGLAGFLYMPGLARLLAYYDKQAIMQSLKTAPSKPHIVEKLSTGVTKAAGTNSAFMFAFLAVIVWAACGPIFHYSEPWQMVINTGTTIITFLMVFLIQKSQNKDSLAIQLKLNELIAAHEFASNRLVNVENMTEEEMKVIQKYYTRLSHLSKSEESLQTSHSIDEAGRMDEVKRDREEAIVEDLARRDTTK
jgi:low affinity Fe/Cu permease